MLQGGWKARSQGRVLITCEYPSCPQEQRLNILKYSSLLCHSPVWLLAFSDPLKRGRGCLLLSRRTKWSCGRMSGFVWPDEPLPLSYPGKAGYPPYVLDAAYNFNDHGIFLFVLRRIFFLPPPFCHVPTPQVKWQPFRASVDPRVSSLSCWGRRYVIFTSSSCLWDTSDSAPDTTWHEDGGHTASNYSSSAPIVHEVSPHAQHSPDTLLYTEKVTTEYDEYGNVVSSRVEHPGNINNGSAGASPLTLLWLYQRVYFAVSNLSSIPAARLGLSSSSSTSRRQPMVSDDYNRLGAGRTAVAQEAPSGKSFARTTAQKITGTSKRWLGRLSFILIVLLRSRRKRPGIGDFQP